ncbi:MAG: hypothetical protein KDD65_14040, partial [Bacteroidetes bacterium]|nr:hypothetical protein [Bacteroidota bacterium]
MKRTSITPLIACVYCGLVVMAALATTALHPSCNAATAIHPNLASNDGSAVVKITNILARLDVGCESLETAERTMKANAEPDPLEEPGKQPAEPRHLATTDTPVFIQGAQANGVDRVWDDVDIFQDQDGDACAVTPVEKPKPHREFVRFRDKRFKRIMFRRYREITGTIPTAGQWKEAVLDKELDTDQTGPRTVFNRFARVDGVVWIDLCDNCHRRIRVDKHGWQVVDSNVGPLFERHKHQLSLPQPQPGGTMNDVSSYVGDGHSLDDGISDSDLLTDSWMVSAVLHSGPTPICVYSGPMGSAKSTGADRIRSLLDPSKVPLQGETTRRDLPLTMYHNAIVAFDNLTKLSKNESNSMCRAVTGTGQDRRKLYSDTDEIVLQYRRPIIMTAIGL